MSYNDGLNQRGQSRKTKKAFIPRLVEGSVICKGIFSCQPPQMHLRQPYQFGDDLLLWGISIDNLLQALAPFWFLFLCFLKRGCPQKNA